MSSHGAHSTCTGNAPRGPLPCLCPAFSESLQPALLQILGLKAEQGRARRGDTG